jgi:hypothetical protein
MAKSLQNKDSMKKKGTPVKRSIIPTGRYIQEIKWKHRTPQEQNNLADEFLEWYVSSDSNLFFTVFFAARFITEKVVRNWRRTNEYFAYCMDLAEMIREQRLQERLITSSSPTGLIFLLKNLHGYRNDPEPADTDLDQTTINNYPLEIEGEITQR